MKNNRYSILIIDDERATREAMGKFLRGEYDGKRFDNTTEEEVSAWLDALRRIMPKEVMLYSLDRPTPAKNLTKIEYGELDRIAARVRALGIATQVTK